MWNPMLLRKEMEPNAPVPASVPEKDRELIRKLAARSREIAELPIMAERRKLWIAHNGLKSEIPMLLADPECAWEELIPTETLECESPLLKYWELCLKKKIFWHDHIDDDDVVEPWFDIGWSIDIGDYGLKVEKIYGENRGSYVWNHPVKELPEDMEGMHFRELSVDRANTHAQMELAQSLFGDLLPPRIRGKYFWSMGLTEPVISLTGLQELMMMMYDQPEGLHELMAWMRDEHMHFLDWLESEGLLSDTDENDYVGSGGIAYTDELPRKDRPAGEPVKLIDTWGHLESQETLGISPEMFNEFIFPYQVPLAERFGLTCYGCCEPIDHRLDYVLKIPNLRRISVSPWADEEVCAERLGRNHIYSRKPNPAPLCVGFDEAALRESIATTLQKAKGCVLEFNMKDTHTVQNDPTRIGKWVKMAREEIDRNWG